MRGLWEERGGGGKKKTLYYIVRCRVFVVRKKMNRS